MPDQMMSRPVPIDNSHAGTVRVTNPPIVERNLAAAGWKRLARERDVALAERDRALRQRDDLVLTRFQLLRERDAVSAVRDQLARECLVIAADRDRLAREREQLAAELSRLADPARAISRQNLEAACERGMATTGISPITAFDEAVVGDRDRLAEELSEAIIERDAIAAELLHAVGKAEALTAKLNRAPSRWLGQRWRHMSDLLRRAVRRVRARPNERSIPDAAFP